MSIVSNTIKIRSLIIVILLFTADLFSKYFASVYFSTKSVKLLPFFNLTYTQNTGIAWSIQIPYFILIPLSLVILAAIPYFAVKNLDLTHKVAQIAIALVMAGALGNMYDRLFLGYVRDFIQVGWWPVFNLADSFLCIGIFLILVFYGKIKRNER